MADPVITKLGRSVKRRRLVHEVNMGTTAVPDWAAIPGIESFGGSGIEASWADDSDMDSGAWDAQTKVGLSWDREFTLRYAADPATGEYDPVHEFLLAKGEQVDDDCVVEYRVSEVHGGPRVYAAQGLASVHCKEDVSGDKNALARLLVTLKGNGALERIEHPYPHPVVP